MTVSEEQLKNTKLRHRKASFNLKAHKRSARISLGICFSLIGGSVLTVILAGLSWWLILVALMLVIASMFGYYYLEYVSDRLTNAHYQMMEADTELEIRQENYNRKLFEEFGKKENRNG